MIGYCTNFENDAIVHREPHAMSLEAALSEKLAMFLLIINNNKSQCDLFTILNQHLFIATNAQRLGGETESDKTFRHAVSTTALVPG